MKKGPEESPIGIFDSGVGGLTVMKEIMRQVPDEHIVYLGDTARVPYGVRSPETVLKYSVENARFLASMGIKMLVVACNTSSAVSLGTLRKMLPVPVIGVVEPGARAAADLTRINRVAVIGTETTIKSGSYERAIKAINGAIEVYGIACPLFVPLIEEGWLDGEVVTLTAERYLSSIKYDNVDTLVLGCTHYPMITHVIEGVTHIPLIDSAIETAKEVRRVLNENGSNRTDKGEAYRRYFVTDSPEKFALIGEKFLDHGITDISKISLGD